MKPIHIATFVFAAIVAAVIGYFVNQTLVTATGTHSTQLATADQANGHLDHSNLVSQAPPLRHRAGTHRRGTLHLMRTA